MSDTLENPLNKAAKGNGRDEKGRFVAGEYEGGPGRPKGISLLAILKEKLGKTILTDTGEISLAEAMIEQYLQKASAENDGIAIRDALDRIDGKPVVTAVVKTERLSELATAFQEIAKEKDIDE